MSKLNSKTLPIAALVLLVLALLFMATPLLRVSGAANRTGFNQQFNNQTNPGGQNGFPSLGNGTQGQGNGTTEQGGTTTNPTTRNFAGRNSNLFGFGLLSGITGTIVYGMALLASLVAAVGMFLIKGWGKILGILMGVVYLLLAVLGIIPTVLVAISFARGFNALSLSLSILHLVLAVAVIVLALIPAKKLMAPAAPVATVTQSTPPAAGA